MARRPHTKARSLRLIPNGVPRWIRVYDNGGVTTDRYTIVFTGRSDGTGRCQFVRCNSQPNHPQYGVWFRAEQRDVFDAEGQWPPPIGRRHKNPAIGLRIRFADLPEAVQKGVVEDYCALWDVTVFKDPLEQLAAIKSVS